ncbi:hypothetical protein IA203_00280 [Corynebacterium wankanglinii]|nr:hypothetical protein IA203_00280 [Corynebacterium wankanglinii]
MLASDVTGIAWACAPPPTARRLPSCSFTSSHPDGYFLLGPDAGSRKAKASGKGFYVSTGARETLGIAPLTVDLNDRKAANPSYGSLNRGAIESVSRSHPRALAVQVSHDYAAERAEHVEAKRTLDAQVAAQTERDIAAQEALAGARRQLNDASSAQHTAEARRDRLSEEAAALPATSPPPRQPSTPQPRSWSGRSRWTARSSKLISPQRRSTSPRPSRNRRMRT